MAVLDSYDNVTKSLNESKYVFSDLSKAFDTVDHGSLFRKLIHIGVRNIPLAWFKSYLHHIKQFAIVNNYN